MGGIGKTAICRKIAHQLVKSEKVKHLVWLNGAKGLSQALLEIALSCHIDIEQPNWQDEVFNLLNKLGQPGILVIDNLLPDCVDTKLFRKLKSSTLTILANSRSSHKSLFHKQQPLEFLTPEDCRKLFVSLADINTDIEAEQQALNQLIELAGRHTLAVELLAKMTDTAFMTASELLEKIENSGFDLSKLPEDPTYAEHSGVDDEASRTFSMARHFQKLFSISGLSDQQQQLIRLLAVLPYDQYQGRKELIPWFELPNATQLVDLSSTGWLQRQGQDFSMHPVISSAVSKQLPLPVTAFEQLAITIDENVYPNVTEHWCDKQPYLPVLEALYQAAKNQEVNKLTEAELAHSLANANRAIGNYPASLPLFRHALELQEQALGEDHPKVATTLNNLAGLYQDMGEYEQALPLYQRSFKIKEQALGEDHTEVAATLNNLAELYRATEENEQALPLYQQALKIVERTLGEGHPHVATTLNNLALLFEAIGEHEQALPLYQRSLNIKEQALGKDHPSVATTLNNLAYL